MVKIGVMSDLHLGVRPYGMKEREDDFYEAYDKTIDCFIEKDTSIVILGGDIFDKPRPSPRALEVFTNGIRRLKEKNIQVLNIVGNHAMIQAPDFVTADEFLAKVASSNYKLLDKEFIYKTKDVCIAGLPYYFNFELDKFVEDVNQLNGFMAENDSHSKILVVHQAFKEFCGYTGEKLSIQDIDIDNFDLIICGHIHERKLVETTNGTVFLQPGSIERLSIAEARDEEANGKGVYIIDSDKMNISQIAEGFIQIKNKRKFFISDMYIKSKEEVEDIRSEILESVKTCEVNPVVFLTVHDSSNSFQQLVDLTKDLKSDCLTVRFNYFDESQKVDENIDDLIEDGVPILPKVLNLAFNPLEEDETQLGMDLYNLLKDGKDVSKLLDDFLQKRIEKNRPAIKDYEKINYEDFFAIP